MGANLARRCSCPSSSSFLEAVSSELSAKAHTCCWQPARASLCCWPDTHAQLPELQMPVTCCAGGLAEGLPLQCRQPSPVCGSRADHCWASGACLGSGTKRHGHPHGILGIPLRHHCIPRAVSLGGSLAAVFFVQMWERTWAVCVRSDEQSAIDEAHPSVNEREGCVGSLLACWYLLTDIQI